MCKKKKVDEKYDAIRIKALPAVTFFQKLTFRASRFLDNVFTETTRRTLPEIPLLLSKLVVIRRPLTYRSCSSSIDGRTAWLLVDDLSRSEKIQYFGGDLLALFKTYDGVKQWAH